jgi:hypothetical protein
MCELLSIASGGITSLGGKVVLAAEILAGRRGGIRIEPETLMFFDPETRELLRTRPNPLTPAQVARLRGNRPAGPPPRPSVEPIRIQRRASKDGIICVCNQKVALGRIHRYQTVPIWVSDTTLAIELDDGETRVVRRTTTTPVINIKSTRPSRALSFLRPGVNHHLAHRRQASSGIRRLAQFCARRSRLGRWAW